MILIICWSQTRFITFWFNNESHSLWIDKNELDQSLNPLTTILPHAKPVNWFALQFNWLVSIWWGRLVVNGLKSSPGTCHWLIGSNENETFKIAAYEVVNSECEKSRYYVSEFALYFSFSLNFMEFFQLPSIICNSPRKHTQAFTV